MVDRLATRTHSVALSLSLTLRCVELSVEEDAGITDLPKTRRDHDHLNEGGKE